MHASNCAAADSVFLAAMAWVNGGQLMRDAAVIVRDGAVHDIVPQSQLGQAATGSCRTYRCTLLLPGMINAHSHLEYTHMAGRLPNDAGFAGWIRAIIGEKAQTPDRVYADSVAGGLRQLAAGGVTTVVDTFHSLAAGAALENSPLRVVRLYEVIGLTDESADAMSGCLAFVEGATRSARLDTGLAPHAPYSVGRRLRAMLREYLADHPECVVSWHLHECDEEDELFVAGRGALADLLAMSGLPLPFDAPPMCSPCEFLESEGLLGCCDAAVHLNTASTDDLELFAVPKAMIHCPGTHTFFGRPPFPAVTALRARANLCLGTDSLASSSTLNMLELLKAFGLSNSTLTGPQLLATVTTHPARSRIVAGLALPLGVIRSGAPADLALLDVSGPLPRDLGELLLHPCTRVSGTFVGGKQVHP